jgi:hypothetical protein
MNRFEIQGMLEEQKKELINFMKEFFEDADSTDQPSKWLKSSDVCEQLSCSSSTLCRMRNEGILPYSLIQGTYYHLQSDVDKMMEEGRGK